MIDMDEIRRRAEAARDMASANLNEARKRSDELSRKLMFPDLPSGREEAPDHGLEQAAANARRQVEILGQVLGEEGMAQMAVGQELLEKMVDQKVAEAAALGREGLMSQMLGEDMGLVAAALETLAMEEDDDGEEEAPMDQEMEQGLYTLLEEAMARIGALPEPEPVPYGRDAAKWERFGILLSGIVSSLNSHSLDGMDVEEHIPVLEQQVASTVRRSWGIDGRGGLLDMIRYLIGEGYVLRYRMYSQAEAPEELWDEDTDEEGRENIARAWRFARRYRDRYAPGFMSGWDIGRAAMLTRWGSYLGWITQNEAVGILWELSQKAAEEIRSWREFAQSYLFGGLMWKLLCGDSSAAGYLGYLADAATNLIVGSEDRSGGQWRDFPWPAGRKIGFAP